MRKWAYYLVNLVAVLYFVFLLVGFGTVTACFDNYNPQSSLWESMCYSMDTAKQLKMYPSSNFAIQSRVYIDQILGNIGLQSLISTNTVMTLAVNWKRNFVILCLLSFVSEFLDEAAEEGGIKAFIKSIKAELREEEESKSSEIEKKTSSPTSGISTPCGSSTASAAHTAPSASNSSVGSATVAKAVKTCENCMQSTNTNQDRCIFCGVKFTGRNIYAYIPSAIAAAKRTCPNGHCYAVGTLTFCPDCGTEYPIVQTSVATKPTPPPVVEKPATSTRTPLMRRPTDDDL